MRRAFQIAHFFHVDPRVVLGLPMPEFQLWEREAWAIVEATEQARAAESE